jgi:hypothetical protein
MGQQSTTSLLKSIVTGPSVYKAAVEQPISDAGDPYNNLMGRGNLLLLTGRPSEARQCFLLAGQTPPLMKGKKLFAAVEGVARTIKAECGVIGPANAFTYYYSSGTCTGTIYRTSTTYNSLSC